MFTGLIHSGAFVTSTERRESFVKITISFPRVLWEQYAPVRGSSIAINGVCLTVVTFENEGPRVSATFDVSPETLALTNLGGLVTGEAVHTEASLKMGAELGGHWVLGHVDGCGTLKSFQASGEGYEMLVEMRGDFRRKMAPWVVDKGSVAVDGVSLTINSVRDFADSTELSFFLIPHTIEHTRFKNLPLGAPVNLEGDVVGKFILRSQKVKELGL